MKKTALRNIALAIIMAMALAMPAANAHADDPRWESRKPDAVRDFIEKYKAAYESGDIIRFMKLFSITAIENGNMNYAQIAQNYEKNFQDGPYTYTMDQIKSTTKDGTYIVTAHYTIKSQKPNGKPPTEGYLTWVLITDLDGTKLQKADYSTGKHQAPATTTTHEQASPVTRAAMVQQPIQQVPPEQVKTLYEKEQFSMMLKVLRESPTPIRTQDRIVRVFILPYTDFNDRLHGSTYTYLKIEDGRWLLGDYLVVPKKQIKQVTTPLENTPTLMEEPAPQEKQKQQQAKDQKQPAAPEAEPEGKPVQTGTYQ